MKNFRIYKGDSEAIFVYIQQLTREQKKRFTQQFKPGKGKKKPLFYQLYEGLQRLEAFDEETVRKLIDSKDFIKALRALTEKLIYIQLLHEKEEQPRIAIIQAAMELGAIHIVRKTMVKEVQDGMDKADLAQLLIVWRLLNHLRRTFGVDLRPDLPPNCPSELEALHCLQLAAQAGQLLDDLEPGFQWLFPERLELVGKTLPLTETISKTKSLFAPVFSYPAHKVMTRVHLLAGQLDKAIDYQLRVIRFLPTLPMLTLAEVLHEYFIMAHLWASGKQFEPAFQLIEVIQSVVTRNPMEENLRLRFEVKCLLGISMRTWNLDLALRADALLVKHADLFRNKELGMLNYQIALVHFVHGAYEIACKRLRDLINLPKAINDEVSIWADLLLMAAYQSRSEKWMADDGLKACQKMVDQSGLPYAQLIHRFLSHVIHLDPVKGDQDKINSLKDAFKPFFLQGGDVQYLWYFDVLQWFEADNRGLSPKALHDSNEPGWAWNGLVDDLDLASSYRDIVYPLSTP